MFYGTVVMRFGVRRIEGWRVRNRVRDPLREIVVCARC